jgi:hypothetical protein
MEWGPKRSCPRTAYHPPRQADIAFGALILGRIQGVQPDSGRIIHGCQFKVSRVALATLSGQARDVVDQVRAMGESTAPSVAPEPALYGMRISSFVPDGGR